MVEVLLGQPMTGRFNPAVNGQPFFRIRDLYRQRKKRHRLHLLHTIVWQASKSYRQQSTKETFGFFLYGIVCFIFTYLVLSVVIHFSACRFLVVQMPIGCDQMCVWADWTELCFFFCFCICQKHSLTVSATVSLSLFVQGCFHSILMCLAVTWPRLQFLFLVGIKLHVG